jgi:hypothetical protein
MTILRWRIDTRMRVRMRVFSNAWISWPNPWAL